MPTLDPNQGMRAFTLTPAFPTHNGQDPIGATRLGFTQGSIAMHDGTGALTVGWLDLHQNVSWALSQAPWVSQPFELSPEIPGSIGDGAPTDDVLKNGNEFLQLSGADLWVKDNLATFEVTSADLPAPLGSPARILSGSLLLDHGNGLNYCAQLTSLSTRGPDTASVLFGSNPSLVNGVPQSTVTGQHMMVFGAGASVPIATVDAQFHFGYSCYGASGTALSTGGCNSGTFLYGKLHHGFSHFDMALEGTYYGPTYAPAILDYGTLQNVWTYPAAWPGTTLRNTYQLVDNSDASARTASADAYRRPRSSPASRSVSRSRSTSRFTALDGITAFSRRASSNRTFYRRRRSPARSAASSTSKAGLTIKPSLPTSRSTSRK